MSASDKKKLRKEQADAKMTERQKQAKAEAKKTKAITITFIVIMLAVILVTVADLSIKTVNQSGIIERTATVATIGDRKLNAVQVNYYLYDVIKNQYTQWSELYGSYLSMMGLSTSAPLNTQYTDSTQTTTWADAFLTQALEKAKSDYALYDKAMAEGFKLTEEDEATLELSFQQLSLYAAYYAGGDVNEYLQSMYGPGANLKTFKEYTRISYIASEYYNQHKDSLTYDDNAIRTEDNKDLNLYTSFSYATYYLSSSSFLEGGTKDDKGNISYTDAEKEAALKKAEEIANSLLTAKDITELDTAIKALEINKDNASAESTKNDLVMYSYIPESMQSWITNKERQENDITIIVNESKSTDANGKETKTTNGYYVVLFQHRDENLRKLANVRHLLVAFEGGTTGSDGNKVYSEVEKGKAKTEADKLLADWKSGAATEESFIELVKKHSDDTGSKDNGGLIEDIHRNSQLVDSFLAWSVDADRKVGDTTVLISEYGYHVMFYSSDDELTYRDYMISEDLRNADITTWHEGVIANIPTTIKSTKRLQMDLVLGNM